MLNRIRLLALAVVAAGGATLATPGTAYATQTPPPTLYCCCEVPHSVCTNRCCSPRGCRINAQGCVTQAA